MQSQSTMLQNFPKKWGFGVPKWDHDKHMKNQFAQTKKNGSAL
jgi:hypothetical protein